VPAAAAAPATVKKNERRLTLRVVFIGDLFPFAKGGSLARDARGVTDKTGGENLPDAKKSALSLIFAHS
jgi:hypothetical protein